MSDEIILHQYWNSPFSEKVRNVFGMKGLSWRSCEQPSIMPKPHLIPLTGGYRRIPVMQIGADIYCDSQVILWELERRFPGKPAATGGLHSAIGLWTDRLFFMPSVTLIFSEFGASGNVDEAFKKDREALSGAPFDPGAMMAAVPMMREQWRAFTSFLEAQLKAHGDYMWGEVSLSDAHAYMNIWFVTKFVAKTGAALLEEFPLVKAWAARMEAIGYGTHSKIEREEAVAIAKATTSTTPEQADSHDPDGLKPGMNVTVAANDYGREPIPGVLVQSCPQHVAIRRSHPEVGDVVVHFPRAGFIVAKA